MSHKARQSIVLAREETDEAHSESPRLVVARRLVRVLNSYSETAETRRIEAAIDKAKSTLKFSPEAADAVLTRAKRLLGE
jgi:hypothetical protein